MSNSNYETQLLNSNLHRIFTGVYNDFRAVAQTDYMFELPPLEYQDFVDAVEKDYIKCIVLLENQIPTAFLVYTSAISEAIELNIIHCLGNEDLVNKRKALIEKFLELTERERKEKVVCYPMLGSQSEFTADVSHYGFKFVGLAVLRFMMSSSSSKDILRDSVNAEIDSKYKVVPWDDIYFEEAVRVINHGFKNSSDALFDPRYKTAEGTRDILDKIVQGIYGEFLKNETSVLLYNDRPCGFCLVNITGGKIGNIPLVSIEKQHQGKGLAKYMLKRSLEMAIEWKNEEGTGLSEVNVSAETNNIPALKMYRHIGFKEDYSYPQSYLAIS